MGEVVDVHLALRRLRRTRRFAPTRPSRPSRRMDNGYHVATSQRRHPLPVAGDCQRRVQSCRCVPAASHSRARVTIEHFTPFDYRNPEPAAGRRRARRRRVGDRRAAGRRDSPLRPAGDALGRRARAAAAHRIAVATCSGGWTRSGVWNQRYDEIDDLTRARRLPSPQLVGTAERHDARSECAQRDSASSWSAGFRPCATAARCFRAACATCSRSPISRWSACSTRSTSGRGRTARRADVGAAGALRADARAGVVAAPDRSAAAARSARSCGRPGSGPTTAGCTCRSSTRRATCGTTAASSSSPGMYALGLPVLRRRKSTFIHGAEDDAREVIAHLAAYLAHATA